MSLIVQHNMAAVNTNRQNSIISSALSKSSEKLASGYRINRAADDAAGLAISEKMRSQIRGLNQASRNSEEGISLIQTAEGALNETHAILQRMRELCIQAANGTETDDDRANLQDEIEQLQEEIDRIATDTEFNTLPLIDGTLEGDTVSGGYIRFGIYDKELDAIVTSEIEGVQVNINTTNTAKNGIESSVWSNDGKTITLNLIEGKAYSQEDFDALIKNAKQNYSTATAAPSVVNVYLKKPFYVAKTSINSYKTERGAKATGNALINSNKLLPGSANKIDMELNHAGSEHNGDCIIFYCPPQNSSNTPANCEHILFKIFPTGESVNIYKSPVAPGFSDIVNAFFYLKKDKEYSEEELEALLKDVGYDSTLSFSGGTFFGYNDTVTSGAGNSFRNGKGVSKEALDEIAGYKTADGLILQVGANEGQTVSIAINDMRADALGVGSSMINLSTQKQASDSINKIDTAIFNVSRQRASLGAMQNRLEHIIANLDNTSENLQSAESSIRDADMAAEMTEYSKLNILQQAGQSMLAQANQSTQGVLTLLNA